MPLDTGARYLNTGTWADLMSFPDALFDGDDDAAMKALESFATAIGNNKLERKFIPTYVRFQLGADQKISSATLGIYDSKTNSLS